MVILCCIVYSRAEMVQERVTAPSDTLWLTVFVHGIMSVKPHLTTNNFILFLQDRVKDTFYEKSVACMRENEFFYKNQAMGPLGLHHIDPQDLNKRNAQSTNAINSTNMSSSVMVSLFDHMNARAHVNQKNRYYMFGWSGLLSPSARYEDGKKLFEALDKEVARLKKEGFNVKVRVIGYSHGGNVALNLGAVHQKEYSGSSLIIDELIILGTPIQHDTDYLINDPIFKCVYSIYSLSDRVQRLDFFSLNRFFSGRVFMARTGFKLPDKLIQIQLKVTGITNRKQSIEECIEQTSDLRARGIVSGKSHLLKNISPGHTELWAFGWTPQHYRSTYPLYPLPTVSVLPFILYNVGACQDNSYDSNGNCYKGCYDRRHKRHRLIADIRPEHGYILIRRRNRNRVECVVPFVSRQELASLKHRVLSFAPENYTKEAYAQQTSNAIKESHERYELLYAPKGKKRFAKRCRIKRGYCRRVCYKTCEKEFVCTQ